MTPATRVFRSQPPSPRLSLRQVAADSACPLLTGWHAWPRPQRVLQLLVAALLPGSAAAGQSAATAPATAPWSVMTTAGAEVQGVPVAVRAAGGAQVLVLRGSEGEIQLRVAELVQGSAGRLQGRNPPPACEVRTLAGSSLRGVVVDGDAAGETLRLDTRCVGRLDLKLDLLRLVWFPALVPGVDPERLLQQTQGGQDETLFQRVASGLDPVRGIVSRFTAQGVQFEWEKAEKAEVFPYEKVAAVVFHGKAPAATPPAWLELLLRDGSRVHGQPTAIHGTSMTLRLVEGIEAQVQLGDVLAFAGRGGRHQFVSDLVPKSVVETPYLGKPEEFLFRYRRDRAPSGGDLTCAGQSFVRGIGCHSRCVLTYTVPQGMKLLRTRVGIDDEALALAVPGNVTFRVLVDGKVAAEAQNVKGGETPRALPDVDLQGARELTLEVDFGADFHLGDRAVWLGPCLFPG
jgi:hypothetical protein